MGRYNLCGLCGNYEDGCISVCALVSTMGTRADRRQKSTESLKVCPGCLVLPKFSKTLSARVIFAVTDLKPPVRSTKKRK